MYILARLSQVVCKASSSFELCTETAASSDDDASRRASSRASSALARPRSIFQLMSLLNHFVTVCQATGVASALAMTLFLDDVIYEPLRLGDVSWPVAFEMFLAYIAMVEREPALWSLTSVVVKSGAMDSKRAAALTLAKEKYPAVCFRGERLETNPSDDAHTKDPKFRGDKTKDHFWFHFHFQTWLHCFQHEQASPQQTRFKRSLLVYAWLRSVCHGQGSWRHVP
jgi:hypothetical protein